MLKCIATEIKTPFGTLSVISQDSDRNGVKGPGKPVIMAAAFSALPPLIERLNTHYSDVTVKRGKHETLISDAISDWAETGRETFSALTVQQPGGEFMQACWKALRNVKAGQVVSYAELAALAGRPKAVRAAGTACSSNLIAPIVPCHRVIRSDGVIGNYGYGIDLKYRLLEHEGIDF